MSTIKLFLGVSALFAVPLAVACGAADTVDNAFDCNKICQRYADCFDSKYSVSDCASRCRDNSSKEGDYRRKADVCNACITDQACASATFKCTDNCISIVP